MQEAAPGRAGEEEMEDMDTIMEQMDKNGDGKLTMSEIMASASEGEGNSQAKPDELKAIKKKNLKNDWFRLSRLPTRA